MSQSSGASQYVHRYEVDALGKLALFKHDIL